MSIIKDVQKETMGFPQLAIQKVGVRNIEYPITLHLKDGTLFISNATISSYCNLIDNVKGIHMSRISRTLFSVLSKNQGKVVDLGALAAAELKKAHGADNIYVKIALKYPMLQDTSSPAEKLYSPEMVNVTFETRLIGDEMSHFMTVEMVGMSLCPCSKEMSLLINNFDDREKQIYESWVKHGKSNEAMENIVKKISKAGFGAHNQKSYAKVTVEINGQQEILIEDLVAIINMSMSSPVFSVLKRPDEKWVTEVSYMGGYYDADKQFVEVPGTGPKFVEDISRGIAEKLNILMDSKIKDFSVVISNQESIHSQDIEAVAVLTAGRNLQ